MGNSIRNYEDFAAHLDNAGFMTLSGNPAGLANLSALTAPGQWFTGFDTDPWQWKSRIVEEKRAAYARLFFGKPSFVSREWYPLVLAARRGGRTFEDAWESGGMSAESRRIYSLFGERKILAAHEIKRVAGFTGASAGKFEAAMRSLQAGMFLTVSGMTRMTTPEGRPHSWPVTEYMRPEDWAWEGTADLADRMDSREARDHLLQRFRQLCPGAGAQLIRRFLDG